VTEQNESTTLKTNLENAFKNLRLELIAQPAALTKLEILEGLVICNIRLSIQANQKLDHIIKLVRHTSRLSTGMIEGSGDNSNNDDRALIKETSNFKESL
jgi:hypothetical protein